jgi:Tfp pilus assembly protein PilV
MLYILRTKKGITIVEAVIAIFLTMIAAGALAAMQPLALRTGASADFMGRAVAIAQAEAAQREACIMTTGAALPADKNNDPLTVQNITYSITTVTTHPAANLWLVRVRVTWPGTANGVTHNRVVTQQMGY